MSKMRLTCKVLPALFAVIVLMTAGCREKGPETIDPSKEDIQTKTVKGVNFFAANCLNVYYLWNKDIKTDLDNWLKKYATADPFEKVKEIRYKKDGKEYDRWTEITNDYQSLVGTLEGVTTTYGCDMTLKLLDKTTVCAIVTVVYAGGPAEKAGLKRGDVMVTFNGKSMNTGNYRSVIYDEFLYAPGCTVGILDLNTMQIGKALSMTPVTMYEDPVVYKSVFNIGGRKVAYLVYTSFTLKSVPDLIEACNYFKQQGVKELILDLRYNGGGYVVAEEALASMLAPSDAVSSGALFEQEIYNAELTDYYKKKMGENALKSFFKTSFTYTDEGVEKTYSTAGSNIGLSKIYAIVTSGTASASESILVGLKPYMDIDIIGERTVGKFCSGIVYGAEDWYDDNKYTISSAKYSYKEYVTNWGMYLMIGSYADKNGENPCQPDGLTPDVAAEDIPEYGFQWGDEQDPMLKAALIRAGRTDLAVKTKASSRPAFGKVETQVLKKNFGKRILEKY